MKTALTALLITIAPGLAFAQCFGDHSEQVVMSCPQGQMYDADSENCVPLTTS
ncbi:MAG: chitin-binding domain-containing protein [Paracoccaceae bacterium]